MVHLKLVMTLLLTAASIIIVKPFYLLETQMFLILPTGVTMVLLPLRSTAVQQQFTFCSAGLLVIVPAFMQLTPLIFISHV